MAIKPLSCVSAFTLLLVASAINLTGKSRSTTLHGEPGTGDGPVYSTFNSHVEIETWLKESAEERSRFIRDADNLVRCLTIEFEIELGLGSAVVPVGKKFEVAPPQAPLGQRGPSDGYADTWSLPSDPLFLWDRFGRGDDTTRDQTWPAFVLAGENEDGIAFGDVLATVHRLLRAEQERLRLWIGHLSFDRIRAAFHLALQTQSKL